MKGYIQDYETLKEWVDATKSTHWNLYSGWLDKFNNAHLLARNEELDDPEESFALLKHMIEINAPNGGRFTVYIQQPGNRGFTNRIQIPSQNVSAMGGIGGVGAMNPYMLGMIPVADVDKKIQDAKEKWDLERRIEDLEATAQSKIGAIDRIVDKLTTELDVNNLVKAAVAIFGTKMGINPAMIQAMQLNGVQEDHAENDTDEYQYDDPRVVEFLDSVRSKFSNNEDFSQFLVQAKNFFDQNPGLAMQFFGSKSGQ